MAKYPRDLAIRILTRVLSDREPLDEALAALAVDQSSAMRGWLQEVCAGTLRWKGRLDLVLDANALKKKPSGWLRKALLIAVYQLVVQERTNPGDVVNETVTEVKRREGDAPSKFANAILRKIGTHAVQWRALEARPKAPLAEAAQWASLPEWVWKRIVEQRGAEWARSYAMASLERPVSWARGREGWITPEGAERGPIEGSWRLTQGGAITDLTGFAGGDFFIQDISSQMLVAEIAAAAKEHAGSAGVPTALDLCAAPGGKSVGLAWSGLKVTATDRDGARIELLKQSVNRVAPDVNVVARAEVDALPLQDLVWVDAPCTGTGILRRHPDVRWLRQEKELDGLLKVQQELIRAGWEKVRSGGLFAYSVCSVLKDEGAEAVAKAALPGKSVSEWFLTPQVAPFGDGFWATLIKK